jgi:hypothetical protein
VLKTPEIQAWIDSQPTHYLRHIANGLIEECPYERLVEVKAKVESVKAAHAQAELIDELMRPR